MERCRFMPENTEGEHGLESDFCPGNLKGWRWTGQLWKQHHLEFPELVRVAALFLWTIWRTRRPRESRERIGCPSTNNKGIVGEWPRRDLQRNHLCAHLLGSREQWNLFITLWHTECPSPLPLTLVAGVYLVWGWGNFQGFHLPCGPSQGLRRDPGILFFFCLLMCYYYYLKWHLQTL